MTKQLPKVDVVLVGFGWTGAIYAEKLTAAGMEVLALERGPWRDTPKFATTFAQDELRYYWRHGMFQEASQSTVTFRNNGAQTALPMRHWGSFLRAMAWAARRALERPDLPFLPSDFVAKSHNEERYGPRPEWMTVQAYGVTYDELEPHFDYFEKICGICGTAGNLRGVIREGGNPFEGPRSDDYPNPPMQMTFSQDRLGFGAGAWVEPFPVPSANMSRAYVNPLGLQLAPAPIVAFARNTAAATIPNPHRRPRSSRS